VAFTVIEIRSEHALLPVRLLRDRNRTGAYLIMLCVGTAIFGMFFFLTLFMQTVLGYSALKTGIAFLPLTAAIIVASAAASQLLPRFGGRPMLLAGSTGLAGGLLWMSRIGEHSSYPAGVLGPTLLAAAGLGLLFVPLNIVAMSRVPAADSGAASSLLNAGQQIGGSVGLAVLGTLAWTTVASSLRPAPRQPGGGHHDRPAGALPAAMYHHALAAGFDRAFLAAAGIALLALLITIITIRIRRADLTAATPDQRQSPAQITHDRVPGPSAPARPGPAGPSPQRRKARRIDRESE